jgi:uncharacterized repeat protein (TIGR01451 family)
MKRTLLVSTVFAGLFLGLLIGFYTLSRPVPALAAEAMIDFRALEGSSGLDTRFPTGVRSGIWSHLAVSGRQSFERPQLLNTPALTVTKTSVNDEGDPVEPGDRITYTISIINEGTTTATNVVVSDPLPADTELVAGSILITPPAAGGSPGTQPILASGMTVATNSLVIVTFAATVDGTVPDGTDIVNIASVTSSEVATPTDGMVTDVVDIQPDITVEKDNDANEDGIFTDSETALAGGEDVTFRVTVTNNTTEDVTIGSIVDDTHVLTGSDCAARVGTILAASTSISCTFVGTITSDENSTEINTTTVTVSDDENNSTIGTDTSTVIVPDLLPAISVTKLNDANDDSNFSDDETTISLGQEVTFQVTINNTTAEILTLDAISDDLHTVLLGDCSSTTIAANGSVTCTYTGIAPNEDNQVEVNTVSVNVSDDENNSANGSDTSTVRTPDIQPNITVTKLNDANGNAIFSDDEVATTLGQAVTFQVTIMNNTIESLELTSISDNLHSVGLGDCSSTTIAASGSVTCTYTGNAPSDDNQVEVDTATAVASDDDGNSTGPVQDTSTVRTPNLPSSLEVSKTANPTSVPEPGGNIIYSVVATNTSSLDSITITTVNDDKFGNVGSGCVPLIPAVIAAGATINCTFIEAVSGNAGETHTNTVVVMGTDDDGSPVSGNDSADVGFTDVSSSITVSKSPDPSSIPEPGGAVNFTVQISNNSFGDSVTINTLTDNIHGDLNGRGTCSVPAPIGPGSAYTCAFSANVMGDVGDTEISIVTASGLDDDGAVVSNTGLAIVQIIDSPSSINVTETAFPVIKPAPGGAVDFTVKLDNTSPVDSVTINSLINDTHGNLHGQGDCLLPQTVVTGGFYQCTYTAIVMGNEGDFEISTVTANVTDDDGLDLVDSDDVTVTIGETNPILLPMILVPPITKLSVFNDNTGGNVTLTVFGTGVSCIVSNNATQFCGSFPAGTYTVQVLAVCGNDQFVKTYGPGQTTTRVFCQ